jgi:acyl-CoA reductase-like NAD-dependent aldehyde dehydrogenase
MIDGMLGEVLITAEKLTWTIKHGEKALKPSRRPTNLLMMYKRNTVYYEPLGVVAALVSWNYPFHNLIGPVMSAIFAGNGIVVKASENTAWSSNYFSLVARNALVACGHDPNLVQAVTCWPQTANYLTSHPGISHITFIGSREVAHHVAASAAKSLTPCVMELGGKDAAVILDSAASDLPRIVETLVRGTFQSSGQNCVGIERIIACPTVYDKVVSMLAERIPRIRVGSGLDAPPGTDIDMGAMVSPASFDRLESWIASAVQQGARLITGGKRYIHPVYKNGTYFQPTLLVDVTPAMEIAQEECFAPICIVMRAKSAEHAVAIANSTEYSLGASVFGAAGKERDLAVKNIKSGMVSVDDFAVYYAVQMPFGGVGGSGYGRFAGEEGLRGLCNLKSVCEDRLAWAGISTSIPPGLRYPIPHIRKALGFISGMMQFGYAPNLLDKVKGILKLLGNA